MPLNFNRKVILAKIESAYGTDATPSGAANAILATNFSITPLEADRVDPARMKPYLGGDIAHLAAKRVTVGFDVELAGGGAVDTAPKWGPLLRACGFSETINATTSVVYAPVDGSFDSATIYFHVDGQRHRLLGARGNAQLNANAGALGLLRFAFTGLFQTPETQALPTPDFTGFQTPLVVENATTPTFTLDTFAPIMRELTLDIGHDVKHRNLVGADRVDIVDRAAQGSVQIEEPLITAKDYYAVVTAETAAVGQLVHGTAVGNKVTVDFRAQLLTPTHSEQDGIQMLGFDLNLVPSSAGNDEFVITTT